jgi:hypothetical protein
MPLVGQKVTPILSIYLDLIERNLLTIENIRRKECQKSLGKDDEGKTGGKTPSNS